MNPSAYSLDAWRDVAAIGVYLGTSPSVFAVIIDCGSTIDWPCGTRAIVDVVPLTVVPIVYSFSCCGLACYLLTGVDAVAAAVAAIAWALFDSSQLSVSWSQRCPQSAKRE